MENGELSGISSLILAMANLRWVAAGGAGLDGRLDFTVLACDAFACSSRGYDSMLWSGKRRGTVAHGLG